MNKLQCKIRKKVPVPLVAPTDVTDVDRETLHGTGVLEPAQLLGIRQTL
jgi:hypothetical protein